MARLNRREALVRFVKDVVADGDVRLLRLEPDDTESVVRVIERFNLDFDDAYH